MHSVYIKHVWEQEDFLNFNTSLRYEQIAMNFTIWYLVKGFMTVQSVFSYLCGSIEYFLLGFKHILTHGD